MLHHDVRDLQGTKRTEETYKKTDWKSPEVASSRRAAREAIEEVEGGPGDGAGMWRAVGDMIVMVY